MSSQLLLVAFTFTVTFAGLGVAGIASAGTLAVVSGVTALVGTQHRRRLAWNSIGLGRPAAPGTFVLQVLAAVLAGWLVALAALLLATQGFGWAAPDTARFAAIRGDATALLGVLLISWTTAAFGEELLFRGFLQSRLRAWLGEHRFAAVIAVMLQALLFGVAHAYQGPTGMLTSGAIGIVFGLLMLRFRVIWPLVLAHGLIDTVSMLALYAGAVPQ